MSEQPKVTISFTVTPYYAALLMAAYDMLTQMHGEPDDIFDVAPQTMDNYATLMGELYSAGIGLIEPAEDYSQDVAAQIRKIVGKE